MAPFDSALRKQVTQPAQEFRSAPHNIEAEQALLGAILVNNEAYYRVSDFLKSAILPAAERNGFMVAEGTGDELFAQQIEGGDHRVGRRVGTGWQGLPGRPRAWSRPYR